MAEEQEEEEPSLARLEDQLQVAQKFTDTEVSSSREFDLISTRERSTIRSHTTKIVVFLSALTIGMIVLFVMWSGYATNHYDLAGVLEGNKLITLFQPNHPFIEKIRQNRKQTIIQKVSSLKN